MARKVRRKVSTPPTLNADRLTEQLLLEDGTVIGNAGDWVIWDRSEVWVCRAEDFGREYEFVQEPKPEPTWSCPTCGKRFAHGTQCAHWYFDSQVALGPPPRNQEGGDDE